MANGAGNDLIEKIDAENQRFPYCIVWTPIPLLTWLVRKGYLNKCYCRKWLWLPPAPTPLRRRWIQPNNGFS